MYEVEDIMMIMKFSHPCSVSVVIVSIINFPPSVLPYLKGAEENPSFAMYFTRQWQDTLLVSLHNFLAVVFQVCHVIQILTYFISWVF